MIVYAVAIQHPSAIDTSRIVVSPVCAYTSKDEAEKHVQSVQEDVFGDTYYFWEALEVKDRFEPGHNHSEIIPKPHRSHCVTARLGTCPKTDRPML
ncbi:MAG TPA: hypothetical protein VHF07_05095 [Nitrospiraceae bacterium]|nr:hypothetical protein [Nitrospiraceae bacterium]